MADIFALRDSSLNAFLFSDVAMEPNGTILSLLARLGKDPWEEAARWSFTSKDAAIRSLTECISLHEPACDDARLTAARLVALLPVRSMPADAHPTRPALSRLVQLGLLALIYLASFLIFNVWISGAPKTDSGVPPGMHAPADPAK